MDTQNQHERSMAARGKRMVRSQHDRCEASRHGIPSRKKPVHRLGVVSVPISLGVGPRAYALKAYGTCMEPEFVQGDILIIDPDVPPQVGCNVILWIDGAKDALVKKLDGSLSLWPVPPNAEVVPLIRVRQINPPKSFHVDGTRLQAVHSVVHVVKRSQE